MVSLSTFRLGSPAGCPRGLGASPWKPQGKMGVPNVSQTGFDTEPDV